MLYEDVVSFVATYGLIYFVVLFAGVLVYAFWPGNRRKFERAARLPLKED
jgi:cytochrome c oxidase cbb3-type subunit 4